MSCIEWVACITYKPSQRQQDLTQRDGVPATGAVQLIQSAFDIFM